MDNKFYAISLTTAIALGYGAGFATNGFEAKAGQSLKRGITVSKFLATGQANTLNNFLVSNVCPQVESDFGLTAGACTAATFQDDTSGVVLQWREDTSVQPVVKKWEARAHVELDGTWAVGAPQ